MNAIAKPLPDGTVVSETVTRTVRYVEVLRSLESNFNPAAKWGPYGEKERAARLAARAEADELVLAAFWAEEEAMGFPLTDDQKAKHRQAMALSGVVGVTGHRVALGAPTIHQHVAPSGERSTKKK